MKLKHLQHINEFHLPWISSLPDGVPRKYLHAFVNYLANQVGEELDQAKLGNSNKIHKLGSGSFGTAFELKSGKVLKLTNHKSEIYYSYKQMIAKKEHIVDYYNVVKILGGKDEAMNLHFLIMEKLEIPNMTDDEQSVWDSLYPEDIEMGAEGYADKLSSRTVDDITDYVFDHWSDIAGMLQDCYTLGIKNPDIHHNNVGVNDKGHYVFLDISDYSRDQKYPDEIKPNTVDIEPFLNKIKDKIKQ